MIFSSPNWFSPACRLSVIDNLWVVVPRDERETNRAKTTETAGVQR
jgi:hypothetical protein